MKVAYFVRANHHEIGGGDLTQIFSTADAVNKAGIGVDILHDSKADLTKYDLVHCFNSPRFDETRQFFEAAQRQAKPIAFSTIYWSKAEQAVGIAKLPIVERARSIIGLQLTKAVWGRAKRAQARLKGENHHSIERWLMQNATILLPNSEGEEREIERDFRLRPRQYKVVRNAIDAGVFRKTPKKAREDYVLSVGRIERRKNTHKLIEACARLGLDLLLIGGANLDDEYVQHCLVLLKKYKMRHIDHISPAQLIDYYYEARVHALVSWYETPGLSSLEAACGGCTILSTDRGSTREYFRDYVQYCDPFSLESICQGLKAAWRIPYDARLRDYILRKYTWDLAADDTIKAYKAVIHE